MNRIDKIIQINKYKRDFIKESNLDIDNKLMCSSCFKVTSRSFINKYSNEIQCSVCLTQQEIPI